MVRIPISGRKRAAVGYLVPGMMQAATQEPEMGCGWGGGCPAQRVSTAGFATHASFAGQTAEP
jgi:hypothetical protein